MILLFFKYNSAQLFWTSCNYVSLLLADNIRWFCYPCPASPFSPLQAPQPNPFSLLFPCNLCVSLPNQSQAPASKHQSRFFSLGCLAASVACSVTGWIFLPVVFMQRPFFLTQPSNRLELRGDRIPTSKILCQSSGSQGKFGGGD